jgi:uncharacterized protein (DUF305 family)
MKRSILLKLILIAAVVFSASCGQPPSVNKNISPTNHNAFNHNSPTNSNIINSTNSNSTNANSAMNHGNMSSHSEEDMAGMESSPDAANQPYDLQFIDTMIQHHQAAVVMAKMVLEKSRNQELRKFAQKIITDQESEIGQMEAWREQWYPYKLDAINMELPGMKDSMKMMLSSEMDKMEAAIGQTFDEYFLKMMTPHHQGAITMAKDALPKIQHPELKTLAQKIIGTQENEMKQMNEWGGK